jgi:hypothetical protein
MIVFLKHPVKVVQGLQLPYRPHPDNLNYRREPLGKDETYTTNRDRILGFRFWDNGVAASGTSTRLYDTWLGEGFSPREIRAILGLTTTDTKTIRGTYVDPEMEKAGFYVLLEIEEDE